MRRSYQPVTNLKGLKPEMCGRYAITLPPEAVRAVFGYVEQPNFPPRYNVAPTQPVPVVRMERNPGGGAARHFVLMRWGFLRGFVKDPKDFPLVINARVETLAEKPSFRNALRRRRCIFIADAFYEWRRARKPSQPYLFRRRDGAPMALAGLWETWAGPNGEEVDTACIVTVAANASLAPIHDRMPAILEAEQFDAWLDIAADDADKALALLQPAGEDVLEFYPIGTGVNKTANDSAEVQARVDEASLTGTPATPTPKPRKQRPAKPVQGSLF
jgi:putative SOS response-associated peptidase YedK